MYIEPGTGGQLFQILAIMFGAISGFVLLFAGRIRMWWAKFRRSRKKDGGEEEISESEE